MHRFKFLKQLCLVGLLIMVVFGEACSRKGNSVKKPSLIIAPGIEYSEVRREFDNGLSFNSYGFQQEPAWIMQFLSEDSVKIYSPFEKKFLHYPIYFDHDSVFNIAREWLRLKHISKDSMIFQLLQVENKVVSKDRSNVLMKFYSDAYLKKMKFDLAALQRPSSKDTLYIQTLIAKTNRNPDNSDSSFAARNPVKLISKTPAITIKQSSGTVNPLDPSTADIYLNPEYSITINGAYKDFTHNFTVLVDEKGKMHLGKFNIDEEFRESRTKVLKGIIDVYLHRYLQIIPGSTLGMPHTSEIMLYLKGKK